MDHRQSELVDFLKRRVFDPVLRADEDGRSDNERRKLADVKDATRSEVDRYRNYSSAQDLVNNFKDDLTSEPAQKIERESRELNLPTLKDVRQDFESKARDLGLNA
ncbi:MAG: hypothetical protein KGO51_16120 [Alphaproteobacteria bacterium]|nr:hypothetical protein [Alphaproteobacteria bacterium]